MSLARQAFRCLSLIGLGEYEQGLAVINEGLTKARERESASVVGRLTNSLGWLRQELGDFRRATELDRKRREIGLRIKNPNVAGASDARGEGHARSQDGSASA